MSRRLMLLFVLVLLAACGETPAPTEPTPVDPNNPATTGTLSGTVTLENSSTNFANAEFVPGEVIIKIAPGLSLQSLSSLTIQGRTLTRVRSLALASTELYRLEGLDEAETLELVNTLKARPEVADAVPNYLFYSTRLPNDALYSSQWHYPAINLPAAWDRTTGANAVTVAVIDTGILPHPDFGNRLLPGYDFVSNTTTAADGDGRDSNPLDPGPFSKTQYHGTHVAGTIGAASNNGVGVAGVNWGARILPVRALGPASTGSGAVGTLADVTDGALWAAGLNVPGVARNPNPADVLNFSLGGNAPCSSIQQEAFDDIIAAGKIVVVAAGNSNSDAGSFSPANCDGVIVVGATTRDGRRASYSNYGSRIDVMAPGGDAEDAVLSLGKDDVTDNGTYDYIFLAGTSMASPHVAGIASLMKTLNRNITQSQVLQAFTVSAKTLNDVQCNADTGITLTSRDCGAGLVDAGAALEAITKSPTPPPTPNPSPVNLAGTLVGACVLDGEVCRSGTVITTVVSGSGSSVSYLLNGLSTNNTYALEAYKDTNNNGVFDAGDYYAFTENVRPSATVNLSVSLYRGSSSMRFLNAASSH